MLGVVNVMNRILAALLPDDGIRVELIRWEDDVAPQIADGPQPVVNEQVESYEIFLGVLAKRFGTPTGVAGSGTEGGVQTRLRQISQARITVDCLLLQHEVQATAGVRRGKAVRAS